jgi:phi13 family phage major tail protein
MATRIGCDNLVYAKMKTEDTVEAPPVYDTVVSAPGVMSLNINPNSSQETLFADDGPMETASTLGRIEVEIQKNELTSQNKADFLGHTIDSNGAVVYGADDVPPWLAIGFRTLKSNGKYRYVWLYKGKFSEPEDNNETKGDSINFQSDTISGQFARLNYAYTVGEKKVKPWKYELDGDSATAKVETMENWFKAPVMPNAAATA